MTFLSNPVAARALWAMPLLLLAIAAGLLVAGLEQKRTVERQHPVQAEVLDVFTRERSEITRGDVLLRYVPPEGDHAIERRVEMPLVFLKELEADLSADSAQAGGPGQTIQIYAEPGGEGQIVLASHPRAQWIMTFSFAAMALMGAFGFGWLVWGWNRYLKREGDPAVRHLMSA